jgi:hypothetical protein
MVEAISTIDLKQESANNPPAKLPKPMFGDVDRNDLFGENRNAIGQLRKNKYNNEESAWGKVKMILVETGRESTAHGIPHILRNPMLPIKLIWIVCFLASCGFCAYLLTKGVLDYLAYDVVTTIRKMPDIPALFPSVTLCNANMITNQIAYNYVWNQMISDPKIFKASVGFYNLIRLFNFFS